MKNFYIRFFSSCILAPIFLFALFNIQILYLLSLIITFICCYEIFKNIKQLYLSFFLYLLVFLFIFALIETRGSNYINYIMSVWVVFIVWLSDIGGYVFGKLFKGPKLSSFSPNKTISGLIGSIIFSQFALLIPIYFVNNFNFKYSIIIFQLILSLVSVAGDIFFSFFKRINGIKDYSGFIPGHGGMLDRIDGLIFAFIFYYLIGFYYVI